MLPAVHEEPGTLAEGPRWELTVGPGIFAVACRDWAKRERTEERARSARVKDVDASVAAFVATGEWPEPPTAPDGDHVVVAQEPGEHGPPALRAGLHPAVRLGPAAGDGHADLPRRLAVTVVPTGAGPEAAHEGAAEALRPRVGRGVGCVWKLEFQRRGAPHVHMLSTPPHGTARTTGETFAVWLSRSWAEVVDHPDPEQRRRHQRAGTALDYAEGLRATDPRRVAAYFTKHGLMAAKEYQHDVPPEWSEPGTGPGRFWGVWNLHRAVRTVHVSAEDGIRAGRIARRWAKAQRRTHQTWKPRVDQATGRVRYRRSRSRVRLHDQRQSRLGRPQQALRS